MDTPRKHIRIDALFFMDRKYRQLFKEDNGYAATLFHIGLIAFCSNNNVLGTVTDSDMETVFDNMRVKDEDRQGLVDDLIKHELLVPADNGEYQIPNYEKWQFPAKQQVAPATPFKTPAFVHQQTQAPSVPGKSHTTDGVFDQQAGFKELLAAWIPAPNRQVYQPPAFAAYCEVATSDEEHATIMSGVRGYNYVRKGWGPDFKDKVMNLDNWLKAQKFLSFKEPPPEPVSPMVNNPRAPKGMDVVIPDDE